MKITHLSKFYHPYKGGIEYVVKVLSEGQIATGDDVSVVSFVNTDRKYDLVNRVHVYRECFFGTLSSQPLSFGYIKRSLMQVRRSDIVHVHYPNLMAVPAILFSAINNKVIIVHWHSDVIYKTLLAYLIRPLEILSAFLATCVIFTSEKYRQQSYISKYSKNYRVIPLGINCASDCLEKKYINDSFTVLSVGRLVPYKGFELLISSMEYVNKNIDLVIVGNGPLYDELLDLIVLKELSKRVKIITNVDDFQLVDYYKNTDIFCLPSVSRAEAFGVVLLEAMSYCLPLITFNIQGSGVVYVNQCGVIVNNMKSKDLSESINDIVSDKKNLVVLSRESKDRFLNNFTANRMISETYKLYNQLIE
jgi:glycosyltransferase involved in cell wall biosynthesis